MALPTILYAGKPLTRQTVINAINGGSTSILWVTTNNLFLTYVFPLPANSNVSLGYSIANNYAPYTQIASNYQFVVLGGNDGVSVAMAQAPNAAMYGWTAGLSSTAQYPSSAGRLAGSFALADDVAQFLLTSLEPTIQPSVYLGGLSNVRGS